MQYATQAQNLLAMACVQAKCTCFCSSRQRMTFLNNFVCCAGASRHKNLQIHLISITLGHIFCVCRIHLSHRSWLEGNIRAQATMAPEASPRPEENVVANSTGNNTFKYVSMKCAMHLRIQDSQLTLVCSQMQRVQQLQIWLQQLAMLLSALYPSISPMQIL